jgi:hypothetical protein
VGWRGCDSHLLCDVSFIRGYTESEPIPETRQIVRAYFGLLVTLLTLTALLGLNLIYARRAKARGRSRWIPANTLFESEKERDPFLSLATVAVFYAVALATFIACSVRYADSRIHEWDASTPLASSFLGSRMEAVGRGCSDPPCYAMHQRVDAGKKLTGAVEYVWFLTDLVVLILAAGMIVLFGQNLRTWLSSRSSKPSASR